MPLPNRLGDMVKSQVDQTLKNIQNMSKQQLDIAKTAEKLENKEKKIEELEDKISEQLD